VRSRSHGRRVPLKIAARDKVGRRLLKKHDRDDAGWAGRRFGRRGSRCPQEKFLGEASAAAVPMLAELFGFMIEAMAGGYPVIAFRRGAVAESFAMASTGRIVGYHGGRVCGPSECLRRSLACCDAVEERFSRPGCGLMCPLRKAALRASADERKRTTLDRILTAKRTARRT